MRRLELTNALRLRLGVSAGTADKYTQIIWRVAMSISRDMVEDYADEDRIHSWSWLADTETVLDWVDDAQNVRARHGAGEPNPRTQALYASALKAATKLSGYMKTEKALDELLTDLRLEIASRNNQNLEGGEMGRWMTYDAIFRNAKILRAIEDRWPNNPVYHYRALAYELFVAMADRMVFRLDVLCTRLFKVEDAASMQGIAEMARAGHPPYEENAFYTDGNSAFLAMIKYKTVKTYGPKVYELPSTFARRLHESLRRFPRTAFVPMTSDHMRTMIPARAVLFVKNAWVLDDRRPVMDDIRSSLTTRFFVKNLDIASRDAFAAASMSSRPTMEQHYFKTNPEILATLHRITPDMLELPDEEETEEIIRGFGNLTRTHKRKLE